MADINVLFVDDEKNILGALARVFRNEGYGVLLAEGGERGLEFLRHNSVAVVVSDQRMPGMGGVEFLKKAREMAPDAVRMMLTGQADMSEIAGAINEGGVYRYITKPWDDDEIKRVIRAAVERYGLLAENRRLHETTMRQNAELYELNQTLEARVDDRTRRLRESFFAFVALCADIVELHDHLSGGRCKRVAALSRDLGLSLGLHGAELEALWAAALLHEIGLIGVPREVLEKADGELLESERALLRSNPVLSQEIIGKIDTLRQVGLIIRSHMENFDGTGYPDGLRGDEINYGSRILGVCREYDRKRHASKPCTKIEALAAIERGMGKRFDPEVVTALLKLVSETKEDGRKERAGRAPVDDIPNSVKVDVNDMRPGMVLVKALASGSGRLLVAEGTVLTEALIEKVMNFHRLDPITGPVTIAAQRQAS